MKRCQKEIDSTYAKVFSDSNQKRIEFATLWFSLVGFVIHLVLIYAKKFNWFNIPFEANLVIDPISAIYTPFSIILVYEIYLLVVNLPRSFTNSVSKQFEIISLILIRRIFADIPQIDLKANLFEERPHLSIQLKNSFV